MGIAFGAPIGEVHTTGTGTTKALTTTAAVTGGVSARVIFNVCYYGGVNVTSVSGGGLTWTVDKQQNGVVDGGYRAAIVSAPAVDGLASGTTVTVTFSGTYDSCGIQAYYITGAATASVVDITGGSASATNADTIGSATLTTTNAADFIAQAMWSFQTADIVPATEMIEVYDVAHTDNGRHLECAYRVVSATGTYTVGGSWPGATGYSLAAVAYKASALPTMTCVGEAVTRIVSGKTLAVEATFTPPPGHTMFAFTTAGPEGTIPTLTTTPVADSLGGTWTQVQLSSPAHTFGNANWGHRYGLYRRTAQTTGVPITVTYTPFVAQVGHMDMVLVTSPGVVDVVQSKAFANAAASTTVTLTLDTAPSASNTTIASPGLNSDQTPAARQGDVAGWGAVSSNVSQNYASEAVYVKEGNTSTTFTQASLGGGGTGGSTGGVIAELTLTTPGGGAPLPYTTVKAVSVPAGGMIRYNRSVIGQGVGPDLTWCCWVKLRVDTDSYNFVLGTEGPSSNYTQLGTQGNGTTFWIDTSAGGSGTGVDQTPGTWYFLAVVTQTAGVDTIYAVASGASTVGGGSSSSWVLPADSGTFWVGSNSFNSEFQGSMSNVKVWTAALTVAELDAEMYKIAPQRKANLWGHYSFVNGPQTHDESGFGRALSQLGVLNTDTSGPPLQIPATYTEPLSVAITATTTATDVKTLAEQEGFRWFNDNGTETTATPKMSQDANLTAPLSANVRLRTLVDATLDKGALAYALNYKKSTDSIYLPVPVGATVVAPTWQANGTYTASATAVTPPFPAGIAIGDILVLFVETANQTTSIANQGGGTWTEIGTQVGTGTAGSTSAARLSMWWSRYDGVQTAPTTNSAGDHQGSFIASFRGCKRSGSPINVVPTFTTEAGPTSMTIPGATTTVANCLVVTAIADDYDNVSAARYSAWTNASLASITERQDIGSTTANGGGFGMATGVKVAAGAYSNTTVTAATAILANANGSFALAPEERQVYVSLSSNITSSGEVTTARLTPPAGKTTANFTTGRMWDDENGNDTVDIANNGYTELEWCLQAQSPAATSDIYTFRVYAGTTALDTYIVTPQWTIGTALNFYDESGRSLPIAATVTCTDTYTSGTPPVTGITRTSRGKAQSATGGSISLATTSSAFVPANDTVIVAVVGFDFTPTVNNVSTQPFTNIVDTFNDSGGWEWVKAAVCQRPGTFNIGTFNQHSEIWYRRIGSNAVSGTITASTSYFDASAPGTIIYTSSNGWYWAEFTELAGVDMVSLADGSTLTSSSQAATPTSMALDLGSAPTSDAFVITHLYSNNATTATMPSGYTASSSDTGGAMGTSNWVAYKNGGAAQTLTWTGLSTGAAHVATAVSFKSVVTPSLGGVTTGLTAWYDATDAASFTYSSGSVVSQWNDKSASGFHLSAAGGLQPSRTGSINGVTAVNFAGGKWLVRGPAPVNNATDGSFTIFCVAKVTIGAQGHIVSADDNQTPNRVAQYVRIASGQYMAILFDNGVGANFCQGGSPSDATPYVMCVTCTGTASTFYSNGTSVATGTQSSMRYSSTARLALGSAAGSSTPDETMQGDIGEVITYNRALNSTERDAVTAYLTGKWMGPKLFSEDFAQADFTHWDWFRWPHQHAIGTIANGRGLIPTGGSPAQIYGDVYTTDCEILAKLTWESTISGQFPEMAWRIFTGMGNPPGEGYIWQINGSSGAIAIHRVPSYTPIGGTTDASLNAAGSRWFKVRVVGHNHKVKWWTVGSAEPSSWQIDVTDSSPAVDAAGNVVTAGGVGVRMWGGTQLLVDDFTVTDLASPPTYTTKGSLRVRAAAKVNVNDGGSGQFATNTDLTWCCWWKMDRTYPTNIPVMSIWDGAQSSYCITSVDPDGALRQYFASADNMTTGTGTIPVDTWAFIAMSRSMSGGTDLYYALAGSSTLTKVHSSSTGNVTMQPMSLLSTPNGAGYVSGCAFKVWTAALSQAELTTEMPYYSAQRTSNLHAAWPMRNGLDYRSENDPGNTVKWLNWYAGTILSGPKPTFMDVPPVGGGTNYNETGRSITITATVTEIDQADWKSNVGLSIPVVLTITATDKQAHKEPGLSLPITAATTAPTNALHNREATYFPPTLLSYDFAGSGTTVTDRSGNGRNATLLGGATQTAGQLVIGGTGQLLSYTPDATALPQFASVTLKITTAGNAGSELNLWSKMRVANSSNFNVYIGAATVSAVVRGTTTVGPSIIAFGTGNVGPTLVANTTYTVAVTYDGTIVRMYLNGVQTNTANTAQGPIDMTGADTTWSIGDTPNDTSLTVPTQDFIIDDVRFWDRALTASEVAFAAGLPVFVGLVGLSSPATLTITSTILSHYRDVLSLPIACYFDATIDYHAGAGANHYDETLRQIGITAAVTPTDKQPFKALGLSIPIVESDAVTDKRANKELALSCPIIASVDLTAILRYKDLGFSIPITAGITSTANKLTNRETGLSLPITATVTVTDKRKNLEPALSVPVTAVVTSTDLAHFRETGANVLSLPVTANVTCTDLQQSPGHFDETNRSITSVVTTVLPTNRAKFRDTPVSLPVTASVTSTDFRRYSEAAISIPVVSTVTITAAVHYQELLIGLPVTSTVTSTDRAHFKELVLVTTVVATITLTDRVGGQGETLTFSIVSATTSTDRAYYRQLALPVAVPVTVSLVTSLSAAAFFTMLIVSRITATDLKSRTGIVILNDADALYLGNQRVDAVYVGPTKVWP